MNNGDFNSLGDNANFWSSTESNLGKSWNRYLNSGKDEVNRNNDHQSNGYSLRCLSPDY